jgi:hypothetical protein
MIMKSTLSLAAALALGLAVAVPSDAFAGHRRGHNAAIAIGVGAAVLGAAALASGAARASECRTVERCTPVTECWREAGRRVCETTGERCRAVRVCD